MIWEVIAGLLIAFILFVIVLLLFPVTVFTESSRSDRKIIGTFCITWLTMRLRYTVHDKKTELLLFGRTIHTLQSNEKLPVEETPEREEKTKPSEQNKNGKNVSVKLVINIIKPLLKLFKELLTIITFRYLSIDTTYGLENPAHTGFLTGFLHAVKGASLKGENILFTPDFTRPILDWEMSASASIIPIRIFPPIIRFFTNWQVLRSGWKIIRS